MNATVLQDRVLVLNSSWAPITTTTVMEAICKLFQGRAKALDANYVPYDFENWVMSWEDASKAATELDERRLVSGVGIVFPAPEIIVATHYSGFKRRKTKMSRRNIFLRDAHTCQYCGVNYEHKPKRLNIDHVMPRSRGGRTVWKNVVISCIPCNDRKGAQTPAEAGMKLLRKPIEPHWSVVRGKDFIQVPKSWEDFLGKMYWDVSLND